MINIAIFNTKLILKFSGSGWTYRSGIWQYFSYLHPSRYFIKSFKEGSWDGTISMFSKTNELMVGFLPMLLEYLDEEGASYTVQDFRENSFEFTQFPVVPDDRRYQLDVVKTIANSKIAGVPFFRGIIKSATNSGKSYMMSYLVQSCTAKKILFLVASRVIPKQMAELFSTHDTVGSYNDDCRITLATPKKMLNDLEASKDLQVKVRNYDLILVDESHKAGSATYRKLFSYFNPYGVLFFSATALDVQDIDTKLYLVGASGDLLTDITNKEMVTKGLSLKPLVKFVDVAGITTNSYRQSYQKNIIDNTEMHDSILQECLNTDKIVLIVVQYLEHAYNIQDYFSSKGFDIPILSGEDYSEDLYQRFKNRQIQWMITTMVIKEGANLPVVGKQIHAFGGKSSITVTQIVGRGQRVDTESDNTQLEIVDFKFDVNYLKGHYAKRLKVYKEIGAEILT